MVACSELPVRSAALQLAAQAVNGRYNIRNRLTGAYLRLREPEYFLLTQLDGTKSADEICQAFNQRFSDPLSLADLNGFLALARRHRLVREPHETEPDRIAIERPPQSVFYFRFRFFDPDRLLVWLIRPLAFLWTRSFLAASLVAIGVATLISWSNRQQLLDTLANTARVDMLLLIWGLIVVTTLCHEFAHGLTCRHYDGEVHEIGMLMLYFTPCFYCNVTDAWLIPDRGKRLWITLAGGYCDLCLWAAGVFVWRLSVPGSLTNHLAAITLTVCGGRILLNLNPLIRLDGYYLLTDLMECANLRDQGQQQWMAVLRWLLWGAKRPAIRAWVLTYGIASCCFLMSFLFAVLFGIWRFLGDRWGLWGAIPSLCLGWAVFRSMFTGFFGGEVSHMFRSRRFRTACWVLGLGGLIYAACTVPIPDRVGGTFTVKPGTRAEIRAPIAGFLRDVSVGEGEHVSAGLSIGRLEVPDLVSLLAQKRAEIRESQARLRQLEAGPRPEEIEDQRRRVQRLEQWSEQGRQDLNRAQRGLTEELANFDAEMKQVRSELDFAVQTEKQVDELFRRGAMAGRQRELESKKRESLQLQCEQVQSRKRAREASGTISYEAELGRREQELADAQARLALLEARGRPEEVDAEQARLARLQEEQNYLTTQQQKQEVTCPVTGWVITPRVRERVGAYFEKGELICTVENVSELEVEIGLAEQDVLGVKAGQAVSLKARSLPFHKFDSTVSRLSPAATVPTMGFESNLIAYCTVANPDGRLRSGMTGYGRVQRGETTPGALAIRKVLQFFRTEFWW